jgi:hypothetical protein
MNPSVTPSFAKPGPLFISVTSTLYDRDAGGNLLMTRSDDNPGPGFGTYTEVNRISSHIVIETGAWQMFIGNQTERTAYLALQSNGIPLPDGYYSANVEIYSQCFDASNNAIGILSMTVGQSNGNCSFGMDFAVGRTKYKLAMVPTMPGTGRALVTCNAPASGPCNDWTIVPNPDAANAGVANLYHYTNNGGLVLDGVYSNSYSVRVSR